MALVLKDRVKETSTTAGTGTITLAGAVAGFQSFAAVGNGNTTYYAIVDPTTGDWEVGIGTYTSSGTTLSRTTVLSSSNSGSLVSFAANQKDVFVTYPAEEGVWTDASGVVNATSFGAITATSAALTTGTVSTTPTSNTDIANKQYVDTVSASGIHYHDPVYVEVPNTFGNLNATYNNGASGVGATLTNAGTQAAFTADGISVPLNSRVLVYNQTNAAQNGVYTLTTVGSGSTNWVLTRATDANTYSPFSPNSLGQGDAFFVTNGNTGAGETYICNTVGTITFGTTAITFAQISDSTLYTAGTGLTLTGTEFSITPTGTAGTYGSASSVPVLTTNASGQVTSVTNTTIAINGSQVSGNISGSAGSVANALTFGTYLTGGTYNGSAAVTATVDATSANTASKVVARDSSGNFSAGTITATLSGSATSATTATNLAGGAANQIAYQSGSGTTSFATAPSASNQVLSWNGSAFSWSTGTISGVPLGSNLNSLTAGTYLTGTAYNGSAAQTWTVDATSANTASKVVARDASGNFSAGTITATLSGAATSATTATNIAGGAANQIPYNTAAGTTSFITAPTTASTYLGWNGSAFTYSAISTPNAVTFNNGGTGDASGTTFNGSVARTISYNTVGASPLAGSSSLTTTGTVTSGTWSASFGAVSGANLTNLTAGNLSGTIPSGVLGNSTAYVGTTAVALNRASANQALTGILSATMPGSTSGSVQVIPAAVAGTGTVLTLPATTGTAITSGDTGTVTNTMLAGSIADTKLSTISTAGKVSNSATTATNANTASAIVARDASGNFSAGTITATLSGSATSAGTATTATTATNLAGGVAGAVPYQSGAGATGFSAAGTSGQVLTSSGTTAPTWTTATSANTASAIVQRDASGNFSAGTITATLSGNASTATSATSATTATNLAGGSAGTVPYQSAAGTTVQLAAGTSGQVLKSNGAAAPSWVNGTISGISLGSNLATLTFGTYLTGTSYNGSTAVTLATNATNANTASTIVARDASGNFSAGTITAALSGNATTATSATSATTATNLAGGSAGTVPYQSAAGTTVQLAAGTAGQFLKSNGAAAPSWSAPSSIILESAKTISANYTIGAGNNGLSVGPVTINSGVTVTVGSGQRWLVL